MLLHSRIKGYKGLADQVLLRALFEHTHTQHTHMSCRTPKVKVSKVYKGLADQLLLRTYNFCTTRPQNKSIQGCLQGKGYKGLADQARLEAYTRAAVSTQICAAENINSGLHLRVKGNKDLADQLQGSRVARVWPTNCSCKHCSTKMLLRARTCVLPNTQKSRFTRVWPTNCY